MIPLRDANPTRRTSVVTLGLIVVCLLVWAFELTLLSRDGTDALDAFITHWGIVPAELTAAWSAGDWLSPETATLVTSQFLHGGWLHVLGNLLFLWIFANNIEDRLGRFTFLAFYLAGGVVAGLTQIAIDPASSVPTIGASGAIAASLGAYLVLFPRARITSLVFLGFFYQLIDVPAVVVLLFWIVLQAIDGLASLGVTDASGGVAFFAHIGGFAFGVLVGLLVVRRSSRSGPVTTTAGGSLAAAGPDGPAGPTHVG
jgi:membrane associated rhomboid family serine protease